VIYGVFYCLQESGVFRNFPAVFRNWPKNSIAEGSYQFNNDRL
jgi:hypothetical protein